MVNIELGIAKTVLFQGMFKDDAAFRAYLTDKITPKKQLTTSQVFYSPLNPYVNSLLLYLKVLRGPHSTSPLAYTFLEVDESHM